MLQTLKRAVLAKKQLYFVRKMHVFSTADYLALHQLQVDGLGLAQNSLQVELHRQLVDVLRTRQDERDDRA